MKKLLLSVLLLGMSFSLATGIVRADTASGSIFSVQKTAAPEPAGVSSDVSFAITITNISSSGAAPTEATDTLPDGFTYNNDSKLTDVNGIQGSFSPVVSGQTLTWTFDGDTLQTLEEDENIVISFTAKTPSTTGVYTNHACLSLPENVCTTTEVTVQTNPNTGLAENILLLSTAGTLLILIAMRIRRKKISFEDAMLKTINN
jgi:fimbrial isopeptide formation D2 family protein